MSKRRWWALLFALAVIGLVLWPGEDWLTQGEALRQAYREHLSRANGAMLFAAIALLPLVGVPVSPLWVATGALLGVSVGLPVVLLALFCNLWLAYWLAHHGLRSFLKDWLRARGWSLPTLHSGTSVKLVLLVRVTPGLPLFAQNYLLGIAGVPLGVYLWLSMAVQGAYAVAFVVFGEAALSGRIGILLAALLALVALALLFSRLVSRWQADKSSSHDPR